MKGNCLCGAITVTAPDRKNIDACHCGMCRRWGGGPALGIPCGSEVQIDGLEHLKVFQSSDWAERAFCSQCGTHIFYRLVPSQDYFLPAGLFQDDLGFEFTEQIFVDRKPPYYDFANPTANLTEAEVFAKFASPEES
ncbi:MAG: GFA family protein [Oculatellaceae cyanobacterium Prado106]|jgi:hypothetical protein|nr:GFA family protein [Oculatellaceae cyanobacterium Prado106]